MSTTQIAEASMRNDYLEQVVRQKAQLEYDLKARRSPAKTPMIANLAAPAEPAGLRDDDSRAGFVPSGGAVGGSAVDVRVSGVWRWKNVVGRSRSTVAWGFRFVSIP